MIQFSEAPKKGLPDLDDFFKRLAPSFKKKTTDPFEPKKINWAWWGLVVVLLLLVLFSFSSIITVKPGEQLVITRFGAYYKTEGEGLHWTLPLIDTRTLIVLNQVNTIPYQGQVLTEDGALVQVSATLDYQVTNPETYLFSGNTKASLQGNLSQAVTSVVMQSNFEDLLNDANWKQVGSNIQNQLVDASGSGVKITGIEVTSIGVPSALSQDFNSVIANAQSSVKQMMTEANTFASTLQPLATQKAASSMAYAEAEKFATMINATRDAAEFSSLVPAYKADSAATLAYLPLLLENNWRNVKAISAADATGGMGSSTSNNQAAYMRWRTASQTGAQNAQN